MSERHFLKLGLLMLALVSGAVHAQYKWIDADGRVGYGDLIPSGDIKILKGPTGFRKIAKRSSDQSRQDKLPFELRKIAARFPVTLYTSSGECAACDMARQHLAKRGIPYAEKQVGSNQDLAAFNSLNLSDNGMLPVVTAGASKQVGYHATRWDTLLNSSGYPKESRLPKAYENPAPEALAVAQQAATPSTGSGGSPAPNQRASVLNTRRLGPGAQRSVTDNTPSIRF